VIPKNLIASLPHERKRAQISPVVVESARADAAGIYRRFDTRPEGLSDEDADARRGSHGPNVLEKDRQTGIVLLFVHAVMNPLVPGVERFRHRGGYCHRERDLSGR
jgi:hypothetical protein